MTILFSAFTALFTCLVMMKLPRLHHPLFNSAAFARFSDDRFFLCIEARDPRFSLEKTKVFLAEVGGQNIELVEDEV